MRRKISVFLIIVVCYLLQSTVFEALSFASITPNLLIVAVSAFGFMRGKKEGLIIGFFCGLLLDIFTGSVLGFYALIYMYIGIYERFLPEVILSGGYQASNASDCRKRPFLQPGHLLFYVPVPRKVPVYLLSAGHYYSGACIHHGRYHIPVFCDPKDQPET